GGIDVSGGWTGKRGVADRGHVADRIGYRTAGSAVRGVGKQIVFGIRPGAFCDGNGLITRRVSRKRTTGHRRVTGIVDVNSVCVEQQVSVDRSGGYRASFHAERGLVGADGGGMIQSDEADTIRLFAELTVM